MSKLHNNDMKKSLKKKWDDVRENVDIVFHFPRIIAELLMMFGIAEPKDYKSDDDNE